MRTTAFIVAALIAAPALAQQAERRVVVTITNAQLRGGVVSELAWDGGVLVLQGVFANPDGTLNAQYFVLPAESTTLEQRTSHTTASAKYWEMKSRTLSPTGLGQVAIASDAKLPMYGIAGQGQRMSDAIDMGGTQKLHIVRLNSQKIYERHGDVAPYEGEIWSWSPPELNRIAYVNKDGDLWIARADGSNAVRLAKGNFTLPAWSDDGKLIAVAERKNSGKTWEISVVFVPPEHRQPR